MIDNFEKNKWLIRGVLGFLVLLFGVAFLSLTAKAEMIPHPSGCAAYTEGLDEAYSNELDRLRSFIKRGGKVKGDPDTVYAIKNPKKLEMNGIEGPAPLEILYSDGNPVVGVIIVQGRNEEEHLTLSCFTPMPSMPTVEGGQLTVIQVRPNT